MINRFVLLGLTLFQFSALKANEQFEIQGSTTIFPIVKKALASYTGYQQSKKMEPTSIEVKGGGSSIGIKFVLEQNGPLGMASRSLLPKEKEGGAVGHLIGRDGLGVVVSEKNPVKKLTLAQIKDIFTGKITNWSALGGASAPIVLLGPNTDHGTHEAFIDIIEIRGPKKKEPEIASSFKGFKSHRETMTKVGSDDHAIGWAPVGEVNTYGSKFKVRAVDVNDVAATNDNVKKGTYPLVRELNLVTKGKPTAAVQSFIDYLVSDEGQKIVEQAGFVGLK